MNRVDKVNFAYWLQKGAFDKTSERFLDLRNDGIDDDNLIVSSLRFSISNSDLGKTKFCHNVTSKGPICPSALSRNLPI